MSAVLLANTAQYKPPGPVVILFVTASLINANSRSPVYVPLPVGNPEVATDIIDDDARLQTLTFRTSLADVRLGYTGVTAEVPAAAAVKSHQPEFVPGTSNPEPFVNTDEKLDTEVAAAFPHQS